MLFSVYKTCFRLISTSQPHKTSFLTVFHQENTNQTFRLKPVHFEVSLGQTVNCKTVPSSTSTERWIIPLFVFSHV